MEYHWRLLIKNEREENVSVGISDTAVNGRPSEELYWAYVPSIWYNDFAAHSKGYSEIRVSTPKGAPSPIVSFKFTIYTMGFGKLLYESDTLIELPLPETIE